MKKLKYAEKEMFKMMAISGGFTYAILTDTEHFGMNSRRLNDLCKNDYLEKHEFNYEVDGKTTRRYTYSIANKAIEYL